MANFLNTDKHIHPALSPAAAVRAFIVQEFRRLETTEEA
jgi:hypothetical protein